MSILKTKSFAKAAKAEQLTDKAIRAAVDEVQRGLIDAKLGGNLVKKRVAVGGKGKSGGLRTILVYRESAENVFCIYVFAKNERDNITAKELKALKQLGKTLLNLTAEEIKKAIKADELQEIIDDGEEDDKER
jgi:Uncharacterized protein conserved in bacteria